MLKQIAMLVPAGTLAAAALVASISTVPSAAAAAQCGPRATLLEHLSKQFKEEPRALGLVGNKGVMEVYVSTQGSWTLLITSPTGTACIVAAGESWEELPKLASGPAA